MFDRVPNDRVPNVPIVTNVVNKETFSLIKSAFI